jgi:hypothetical protein
MNVTQVKGDDYRSSTSFIDLAAELHSAHAVHGQADEELPS